MAGHHIDGIEIFKVGTHNGDEYSVADLDAMIAAFGKVGFSPPVKLGHSTTIGERAFGWISKIYRKGAILYADLKEVPREIYQAIKDGGYRHVSAEVFFNLERDGKTYPRVLKALALLGAETPAVSGLKPLAVTMSIHCPYSTYAMPFAWSVIGDDDDDPETREDEVMEAHVDPGGQLNRLTHEYLLAHPSLTYSEALKAVRSTDKGRELLAHYVAQSPCFSYAMSTCPACKSPAECRSRNKCTIAAQDTESERRRRDSKYSADVEVKEKAQVLLREGKVKSFSAAVRQVLAADPALAVEYAACVSVR